MPKTLKFAPRDVFEKILEFAVIPTFDLIVKLDKGVVLVKRKIAPYKNAWALPGLRIMKPETIDDSLKRIAKQELGLSIDTKNKVFVGQFVGRFKTENERQDISTCYLVKATTNQKIKLNESHFSAIAIIKSRKEIPKPIGAMYKFYLEKYFEKN